MGRISNLSKVSDFWRPIDGWKYERGNRSKKNINKSIHLFFLIYSRSIFDKYAHQFIYVAFFIGQHRSSMVPIVFLMHHHHHHHHLSSDSFFLLVLFAVVYLLLKRTTTFRKKEKYNFSLKKWEWKMRMKKREWKTENEKWEWKSENEKWYTH